MTKNIEENIESAMKEIYLEYEERGGRYFTKYGAMKELEVWTDGKKLHVETTSEQDVDPAIAKETIEKFNFFLEKITGYNAKKRRDLLKKESEK